MSLYRCTFRADPELLDALSECLFEAGAEGLQESLGGDALTSYVPTEADAQRLLAAFGDFRARVRVLLPDTTFEEPEFAAADDDWNQKWLDALEPQHVTSTFVLRPTTRKPAPEGERTIWFEPSASFGAGSHPTTRLAASAIERAARGAPGARLLDVGSGNGVLALVGLLTGFGEAVGVDTQQLAAEAFRANAALNGVNDRVSSIWGGIENVTDAFPFVVANIDARTLQRLAPDLARRVQRSGRLWLTGLLEEDAADVSAVFVSVGLAETGRSSLEGWSLLEFTIPD